MKAGSRRIVFPGGPPGPVSHTLCRAFPSSRRDASPTVPFILVRTHHRYLTRVISIDHIAPSIASHNEEGIRRSSSGVAAIAVAAHEAFCLGPGRPLAHTHLMTTFPMLNSGRISRRSDQHAAFLFSPRSAHPIQNPTQDPDAVTPGCQQRWRLCRPDRHSMWRCYASWPS